MINSIIMMVLESLGRMVNRRKLMMAALSFIFLPLSFSLCACSEGSEEEGEFDNWQAKNEAALVKWSGSSAYSKILTFAKDADDPSLKIGDYVYVEVLESGEDTETPLYTDTVRVAYRGHFIPTASYPAGLVFDQSYVNGFTWETAGSTKLMVGGTVTGFATALMHMHRGDHWRVHIPYNLGYGDSDYSSSGSTTILGYSNLVFEIALYDFWHPGDVHPTIKAREE